jgi:mono/diheme cytochrome c family protein
LLVAALSDSSSLVRTNAIRIAEALLKSENPEVIKALVSSPQLDEDPEMFLQAMNSIRYSGTASEALLSLRDTIAADHADNPVVRELNKLEKGNQSDAEKKRANKLQGIKFSKAMDHGKEIYEQLCFSCHGADGKGAPMPGQAGHKLAPSFENSPRLLGDHGTAIRTLLHGLTGPLDGKEYEGLMVTLATNDDKWLADITTYIRNSFGNKEGLTQPRDVAKLRKKHASRMEPWTQAELEKLSPPILGNEKNWQLTSSHGEKSLNGCVDRDTTSRYTTSAPQVPGMWVQVELPREASVSSILLNAGSSTSDYPRGYEVVVSDDGKSWSKPIAKGKGNGPVTNITVPETKTRFIRITQTGKEKGTYWSIHELKIAGKEVTR